MKRKTVAAIVLIAGMFLLGGCWTAKTAPISEMPKDPKAAQYGVVVYSGTGYAVETTAEKLRGGDAGDVEKVESNFWLTGVERGRGVNEAPGKSILVLKSIGNVQMLAVEPGERKCRRYKVGNNNDQWCPALPFHPKNIEVKPGEVVYLGHTEVTYTKVKYGLAKLEGITRIAVSDKSNEAWAYVDTLPNIKEWPRRNATQVYELKAADVAKVMTQKGCLPKDEVLKDTSLKAGEPCETGMVIETVNGEKKVTYNNYPFVDFIAKHGAK